MTKAVRNSGASTAVVTGGSAGVGRAVALAYARRGWNVVVIARGRRSVQSTVEAIDAAGGIGLGRLADVADADAVMRAAGDAAETFGGIDVWINNAMATIFAPVGAISPEEFRRVTEVTYLGQVHGTLAALRHMREGGTVVQVGSALAYRSIPLQSAYCASKAAVRGFTDSLRSELLHDGRGIRLTMVQLPAVNTPQFGWARTRMPRSAQPVPPIFQPESIAEHIVEAARTAPRELWIGEPSVKAIIGTMLVPGFADRILARRGYDSQMTRQSEPPGRPDNLFSPVDRDPGARGHFSDRAEASVTAYDPDHLKLAAAFIASLAGLALATLIAKRKG